MLFYKLILKIESTLTHNVVGGYALDIDPAFLESGRAHFANWGRTTWQDAELIAQHVRDQRPKYVLIELGFNDIAWTSTPSETIDSMRKMVENARAVDPTLYFSIANAPQRTAVQDGLPVHTEDYNRRLREEIPAWSTTQSPVELVDFEGAYSCSSIGSLDGCPAAFDGLHPNFRGEFELAYAFSKTRAVPQNRQAVPAPPTDSPKQAASPDHLCALEPASGQKPGS
ncbi:hypothetical protein GQ53DRAFT_776095 [Thozetella sp. PMI_491]|nr:hypothetical protein GQ53DRAFT_776095 [Thozetella sp. PMI_491]